MSLVIGKMFMTKVFMKFFAVIEKVIDHGLSSVQKRTADDDITQNYEEMKVIVLPGREFRSALEIRGCGGESV